MRASVKLPAVLLWKATTPLLEEERHVLAGAEIAYLAYPVDLRGPVSVAALAADYDPPDAVQVEATQ